MRLLKKLFYALFIITFSCSYTSCKKVKNTAKESINKGGEIVGKSATELIEGVSDGIEKTTKSQLVLDENLKEILETGTFSVKQPSRTEENSQLSVYFIHLHDIDSNILIKAFNKDGVEIGRARTKVKNKKGEAGYYDFSFDPRTKLSANSTYKISISE